MRSVQCSDERGAALPDPAAGDAAGKAGRCVSSSRAIRPSRTSTCCSTTGMPARSMNSRPNPSSGRPAAVPTARKQIAPGRVAERVPLEERPQSRLERRVADEIVELLEHGRRLVVDDRAVVALGLVEIVERLPERARAGGLVHRVRRRLVAEVERLPRVGIGLELGERLGRHERREPFLEPEVVEPAHRDQVAEPLVRDFVQDGREAPEPSW